MKLTKDALMTAFQQMLNQFPEAVEDDEEMEAEEMEEEGEMPMKKKKPGLAAYMQKMA